MPGVTESTRRTMDAVSVAPYGLAQLRPMWHHIGNRPRAGPMSFASAHGATHEESRQPDWHDWKGPELEKKSAEFISHFFKKGSKY
jgi:hypothetical protein